LSDGCLFVTSHDAGTQQGPSSRTARYVLSCRAGLVLFELYIQLCPEALFVHIIDDTIRMIIVAGQASRWQPALVWCLPGSL